MAVDRLEVVMMYCILTGILLFIMKLVGMAKRAWVRKRIADRMRYESRVRNQRGPRRPNRIRGETRNSRNNRNIRERQDPEADHDEFCPFRETVRPTPPDIVTLANEIATNVFKKDDKK